MCGQWAHIAHERAVVVADGPRQTAPMDLASYRALSFDVYGTLIDWEAGITAVLRPWADDVGLTIGDDDLLATYATSEAATERERPTARYPDVLAEAFRRVGEALQRPVADDWATQLGGSVGDWPAFPDSRAALAALGRHDALIILSNVHRDGFAASNERLGGTFAAVITAEDVGAYKPADPHFDELGRTLDVLGIAPDQLAHVAQSLFHDHVPAAARGYDSIWIDRRHDRPGWGATPEPGPGASYAARFESMAQLAAAVDDAFAGHSPGA